MKSMICLLLLLVGLLPATINGQAQQGVFRTTFNAAGLYLTVELLDDDLAHFALSATPPDETPIWTSPMIARTDYTGPSAVEFPFDNEIATPEMLLQVDIATVCVTVTDRIRRVMLTTICPQQNDEAVLNGLTFTKEGTTDIYGLGEHFRRRGGADGNLMGDRVLMPNAYGNGLFRFNGGNVTAMQIPIIYALGAGTENYAVFMDHIYQQYWTFNGSTFRMQTQNAPLRWYMMTGGDLLDLRADYMELTGKPPVPPRQMFGLWVSEYGYEDWDELVSVLESLRTADFPLDGMVLDLQWFGGIGGDSQMGALSWDERHFPDPSGFIAQLRQEQGVSIMAIEESYVSTTAQGYDEDLAQGALVRQCEDCPPISLSAWWGSGSMVDWTNPVAAAWWHDNRRQNLIDAGVIAHWTDLGEPENYSEGSWYFGLPALDLHNQASVHNLYNLFWSQSIWEGYQRNGEQRRPFILSRSGTAGSQRYGVATWSGDIAANMTSLAEQMNAQMHMSLSGIDYFGSDVGGFYRQAADPVLGSETMYTAWLANSALLDVPLRPHAYNIQNQYHTAPSLVGDVASNLANVQLRYEISPYLYTLAHQAYRSGEAVYPPLVYYFQDDPVVRALGSQKMIGSQMMMATLADYDLETTSVYLPVGGWFNFRTGIYTRSAGETIDVPSDVDGLLQAPLFVRDGAVLPLMKVDEQTLNMMGQRKDDSADDTLVLNIYHAVEDGAFTLIEDDGETMAYQSGAVRETTITHQADGDNLIVTVSAANGTYTGALEERRIEIRLFSPERTVGRVLLNGQALPERMADEAAAGWTQMGPGVIQVKSETAPVDTAVTFTFEAEDMTEQETRPLLLAHFMPWYQTPRVSGYWGWHWTMNHFNPAQTDDDGRPQIASQYMPLTGPYDSQDEAVLEYQVLLMKLSGIDGVIVDWYGTADYNDYAALNAATGKLFEAATRAGLRFVLCYEDRTVMTMVNGGHLNTKTALAQGQSDMNYAAEHWFASDTYVSYQGQPLVFVFGPLYFRQPADWTAMFVDIDPTPALITLDQNLSFAALSGYPWPPMQMSGGVELNPAVLESYLERFYRNAQRRDFIVGSAFPGFHDIYDEADVRSSYGYLDARDGQTLRNTLDLALAVNPNIVQLVTWNDYGEGTTIEPTEEFGYQYLEIIQAARQRMDTGFTISTDDLRLPMSLLQARRNHTEDAEANARLDQAFAAIVTGDLATAREILNAYSR